MRWLVMAVLVATACAPGRKGALGAGGDIEVARGFAYAPTSESQMAAYFTAVNHGRVADTLYALSSPRASMAMVHRQDATSGMVKMAPAGLLAVAPGDSLVLEPGGLHVMLELTGSNPPKRGETLPLTLRFRHAGDITIPLPIRAYEDES